MSRARATLLLACLTALAPPLLFAQTVSGVPVYLPLTPGNYWEYQRTYTEFDPADRAEYYTLTLEADTLIDGLDYVTFTFRTYWADQPTPDAHELTRWPQIERDVITCAVRWNPEGGGNGYDFVVLDTPTSVYLHPCYREVFGINPFLMRYGRVRSDVGDTVQIGPTTVPVDSVGVVRGAGWGSGGAGSSWDYHYAPGIGLVYASDELSVHYAYGGGRYREVFVLSYAIIEGQSYGKPTPDVSIPFAYGISTEDAKALPHDSVLAAVYPNPFAQAFTLAFKGPLLGPATYEVVGLLGRRVRAGTLRRGTPAARIHLPDCTPGLYLVRVIEANGRLHNAQAVCRP